MHTRICPSPFCNTLLSYKLTSDFNIAKRKNSKCRSCTLKQRKRKTSTYEKIGRKLKGKIPWNKGISHKAETRIKLSKTWWKKGHRPANADSRKGKTFEQIYGTVRGQKMREQKRKRALAGVLQGTFRPNYSIVGCNFLNLIAKETGTNIQHALNKGEFLVPGTNYFVDGYDSQNNIVYEWDESFHYLPNGSLRNIDQKRQQIIEEKLNCLVIRINNLTPNIDNIKNQILCTHLKSFTF